MIVNQSNLVLIKYKQVYFNFKDNKSCLIKERFRLLFYYLTGFDSSAKIKEPKEVAKNYNGINSSLLLKRFYTF